MIFILSLTASLFQLTLGDTVYGILAKGENKTFTINVYSKAWISLICLQGPIQFARINQNGTLTEIKPQPGTYNFYDQVEQNETKEDYKYIVYGSEGNATYPQYRYQVQYYETYAQDFEITKGLALNHRSEKGYLIINIPMIQFKNGSFIQQMYFNVFYGYEKDKQKMLLVQDTYEDNADGLKSASYIQMTYSDYYTTVYINMENQKDYNYYSVVCVHDPFVIGGETFTINYSNSGSYIWIWLLIALILILSFIGIVMYRRKHNQNQQKVLLDQSIQEIH